MGVSLWAAQSRWYTEQESCRNTGNKSCRCGQGSMSRAQVTAGHGEAASWDRCFIHGCFLILVLFSDWQYQHQCKQPSILNTDLGPGLRWNWVMHTTRCSRLCCLACSCFSRRAKGCPTSFIYFHPDDWALIKQRKKQQFPHNSPPSSLLHNPRRMKVSAVYSKSQQQTNLSTNSIFHKYSFPRGLYLMLIHITASENASIKLSFCHSWGVC